MRIRATYAVTLTLPAGATVKDGEDYIRTAVRSWRGSLEPPGGSYASSPGDPMWGLRQSSVFTMAVDPPVPPHHRRKPRSKPYRRPRLTKRRRLYLVKS